MTIILSHHTALSYWLSCREMPSTPYRPSIRFGSAPHVKDIPFEAISQIVPVSPHETIDILVGDNAKRRRLPGVKTHVCSTGPLPKHSLFRIADNICVVSPCLCLFQLAKTVDEVSLLLRVFEFCGTYRCTPQGTLYNRPVLTSSDQLLAMATTHASLHGSVPIRAASRYFNDNSGSPMETALDLMLTLPYRMGGYCLPKPQLNPKQRLNTKTALLAGRAVVRPDLFWPNEHLVVEYDSDEFHDTRQQITSDALRRNGLLSKDIHVITVTKPQMYSDVQFDLLARLIAKRLGKKVEPKSSDHPSKVRFLRKRLLTNCE